MEKHLGNPDTLGRDFTKVGQGQNEPYLKLRVVEREQRSFQKNKNKNKKLSALKIAFIPGDVMPCKA